MDFRKRFLRDIQNEEVSFVNRPANKKRFLFFKSGDGLECFWCGGFVKNERKVEGSDTLQAIRCENCGSILPGWGKGVDEMLSLKKFLKDFCGEEFDAEKIKKEFNDSGEEKVQKAFDMLNDYSDGFPDELKSAVGVVAKGMYVNSQEQTKKSDEDKNKKQKKDDDSADIEKKTKELSDRLQKVQEKLDEKEKAEKSEDEDEDEQKEVIKMLEDVAGRLVALEEGTGIRKSIDGQDDGDNDGDSSGSEVEDNWPSIKIS